MGAVIRYHLKIDPDKMSEDEFIKAYQQISYILKKINEGVKT